MSLAERVSSIDLSVWVLVGTAAGILCGVFFGEQASVLEPIGTLYIMLMQMCVFPFIVSSLLYGLGSLTPAIAVRLLKAALPVLLLVWGLVFVSLWLVSHAIPEARPPVVVRPDGGQGIDTLLSLLIPSNPFVSLSQNYVPAIVVFSLFYGIAIQRVANKASLLESLDAIRLASVKIWGWIVRIAPFGVFALFADLAGSIRFDLLGDLVLFILLSSGIALILSLWILPSLLSAFIGIPYGPLMSELRASILVAVVTGLALSAAPMLIETTRRLIEERGVEDEERRNVISTTMAVSYPVVQIGNLFTALFIVFAAFFLHSALPDDVWLSLPFVTLLSTVGTSVSTVNGVAFMAQWLGLPESVRLLNTELGTVMRYSNTLASVMGMAFVLILGSFSYFGLVRVHKSRLVVSTVIGAGLIVVLVLCGRMLAPLLTLSQPDPYQWFTLDRELSTTVKATVHKPAASGDKRQGTVVPSNDPTMDRVRSTGVLRVGYRDSAIPFSYFNRAGDLVGHDVELVYALARDLGVKVAFYPITDWEGLTDAMKESRFDLAIGGIYVTSARLQNVDVSETYHRSAPALLVRAGDAKSSLSLDEINAIDQPRILVFPSDVLQPRAKRLFSSATVDVVPNYDGLSQDKTFDAAFWTLRKARAWALANRGFSAVEATGLGPPLSIAFLMPPDSPVFRRYINGWLNLQKVGGFRDWVDSYWLSGNPRIQNTPRWSVWRNVLGRS